MNRCEGQFAGTTMTKPQPATNAQTGADTPSSLWPFGDLQPGRYGAILADPPWQFQFWSDKGRGNRAAEKFYDTMPSTEIAKLPIGDLAATNAALFLWFGWPYLPQAMSLIEGWGFVYKTCAFNWVKANTQQIDLFRDDAEVQVGLGWWTRANSEACLLATRGSPKRLNADVRQAIVEPRREHSRKPEGIHQRIERLVGGPYCELFARQRRAGWDCWGNQTDKFASVA